MVRVLAIMIGVICCSVSVVQAGNVRTVKHESNLAAYLYGGEAMTQPARKEPLRLPARVGVVFVPGEAGALPVPETVTRAAAEAVRSRLATQSRYVSGAQTIPTSYLRPKGGVSDLARVADQFDVDLIVLLAASQFQKRERHPLAAFMDVSIIGIFTIPGTTVDTTTVLEAAVYHVPSRSLVFRADGTDEQRSKATQYGADGAAHQDAVASIEAAAEHAVKAIGAALVDFERFDLATAKEVRPLAEGGGGNGSARENYWEQVRAYRSAGGGAADVVWLLLAGGGVLWAAGRRGRC